MDFPAEFDVIVVGGGHAGTEAALAAARMGQTTLLLTHNIETLGQMSCNPSIGGIGKGHLVREVDALGGAMALATDEAGIQFRILNSSKGPAVRATRAQADRILYKQAIRSRLENQENLWLFQQAVDDLIVEGERVVGAVTQVGIRFRSKTVVLTAGTFLDGKIHVGLNNYSAGRAGDPPAVSLSARLKVKCPRRTRLSAPNTTTPIVACQKIRPKCWWPDDTAILPSAWVLPQPTPSRMRTLIRRKRICMEVSVVSGAN